MNFRKLGSARPGYIFWIQYLRILHSFPKRPLSFSISNLVKVDSGSLQWISDVVVRVRPPISCSRRTTDSTTCIIRLGGLFDGRANDCKNDHVGSGWTPFASSVPGSIFPFAKFLCFPFFRNVHALHTTTYPQSQGSSSSVLRRSCFMRWPNSLLLISLKLSWGHEIVSIWHWTL